MTDYDIPRDSAGEFPLPNHHYDAPVDAKHKANRLGLAGDYHVREIGGEIRYVPGSSLAQLRNAIGEEPKTNLETSKYAKYDAGEKVKVQGEPGTILELHTSEFKLGGQTFEASQDRVLYVVATQSGTLIVTEDEISPENWDTKTDPDPDDVKQANPAENYQNYSDEEVMEASVFPQVTTNVVEGRIEASGDIGFESWPDSWEKADEPARLIALDAWQSMGGSFSGCRRELGSARLCAAFKDEMYGTTEWR